MSVMVKVGEALFFLWSEKNSSWAKKENITYGWITEESSQTNLDSFVSFLFSELVGFPKKVGVINQKSDGRRQTEAKLSHGLSNPEKIDAYSIATDGQTISCRVPRKVPLNKFSIVEVHSSNPLASPKSLTATLVPTSGCDKSGNNGAGGPPTPVLSQGGSSSSSWSRAVVVQQTGHRTYHIILHPRTIGEHMVHVFYNHEPVPGSPFPVTVTGPPTGRAAVPLGHNHIQAFGPGLEHGLLHTFRSEFICDARGAGPGHLTVKVRGPKGKWDMAHWTPPLWVLSALPKGTFR